MVRHVKTACDIAASVQQRLREAAERRRTTMSALVEEGLCRVLPLPAAPGKQLDVLAPLPRWNGGGFLVDIADRDALHRALEEPSGHVGACGVAEGGTRREGNRCTP